MKAAQWPASVRAAVEDDAAPTPSLTDFGKVYDEDDSIWWQLSCGHHQNLLDEALLRVDALKAECARLRGVPRGS